ncbi:hypothetical protein [Piscinibacter sakaiensis]|uniref:Uncharacterized protein n=1 Tax=Piscinibacter sakaiensis TaxID=1547922 RepID=A0A0K8NW64_PISS1|nr:hypothetical protein [Piscinibacter sakaiensis]GAP34534.1 hypothetical protein ISF6_4709 [Piscinibacter sakaiensis]
MSENDDFFAPPPFSAESALQSVRRELRALGLAEREGRFERRGLPLVRATAEDGALRLARVRRPSRTPEWTERRATNAAQVRDFLAELKRQLSSWNDTDD